jgi:hypothetical protein
MTWYRAVQTHEEGKLCDHLQRCWHDSVQVNQPNYAEVIVDEHIVRPKISTGQSMCVDGEGKIFGASSPNLSGNLIEFLSRTSGSAFCAVACDRWRTTAL